MPTRSTDLSIFESRNGSRKTLQTCSLELIFESGTVHALRFEELQSIAPSDTPPCCTSSRKLGSGAIFSNANIAIGNLQWCSLDFQLILKIYQVPYLWVARQLKAHIPPIDSTDWYFESSKYELPTTSVSGRTKNRLHLLKIPIGFAMKSHCVLALENIAREPNFLRLVQHGGVSEGAIDCNSSKRNA